MTDPPCRRLLSFAGRVRPGWDDLDKLVPALRELVDAGVQADA
jgi:hypothetical protein